MRNLLKYLPEIKENCERREYRDQQGAEARKIITQEISRVIGLNIGSSVKWFYHIVDLGYIKFDPSKDKWLFCLDLDKPYKF